MAEDGLLMNFDLGDEPLKTRPIFKGGHWKARLHAKKGVQYRIKKLQSGGLSTSQTFKDANPTEGVDPESTAENPPKRQKLVESQNARHGHATTPKGPREVVSSLFSYNPASKTSVITQTEDNTTVEPSNAPLIDGLDTFTSLGLSTTLATHLLMKLNLKAPTAIQKSAITQLVKDDSDAFIQAETGSGKTLAYLLPIVQRIMELSKKSNEARAQADNGGVRRDSGLFAIILAPTRELCKQISIVLDGLLRCAHWIVASTVIGGDKKKSEKARLRKGLNVLVATPGRLADHLNNTEALDISNVRWLVLDEGDRLMELGFEEEIRGIVSKLEDRRKAAKNGPLPGLPTSRTTVLCSATMKMNVQRLGEISLKNAVHIKADPKDLTAIHTEQGHEQGCFSAPAQLKQSYIIVPAKQRLVSLAALLKRTFARKGSVMKAIVFLSCADSVDFHFQLFTRHQASIQSAEPKPSSQSTSKENLPATSMLTLSTVMPATILTSPFNPGLILHKLHGSLPQPVRTATLSSFTHTTNPSILICTDVASRGLDLPNIDIVIEYDPPFSSDDHLHRVGRTARAGRDGRAVIFLMPGSEEGYVEILKAGYKDGVGKGLGRSVAEEILKKGFDAETPSNSIKKNSDRAWEDKATEWQLEVEKWVINDKRAGEMARNAFTSHVRAYATHVVKERSMFDVQDLHLGHLAKAFALRERPGKMGRGATADIKPSSRSHNAPGDKGSGVRVRKQEDDPDNPSTDAQEAAKKMRKKMKEHMAGANEFNIG